MENINRRYAGEHFFITGASGRVGRRLVTKILAEGGAVTALVIPGDPTAHLLPAEVDTVTGSLTDEEALARGMQHATGIIHLAALMDWGPGANNRLFDANIRGTYLLLERALERKDCLSRIILVSSDEVYPALNVGATTHERMPANPYSFYGLTKHVDEVLGSFYARSAGLPITTARFSLTAAPEEIRTANGWSGRLFFASGMRALFEGLGRQDAVDLLDAAVTNQEGTLVLARDEVGQPYGFQFCDVRDLVHGLERMLVAPKAIGEIYNLSGPSAFSYDEVVPGLAVALGVPYVDLRIPGARFDVSTDIAKAREDLDYTPSYDIASIIAEVAGEAR